MKITDRLYKSTLTSARVAAIYFDPMKPHGGVVEWLAEDFICAACEEASGVVVAILFKDRQQRCDRAMALGQWLVRYASGELRIFSDSDFKRSFEPYAR